MIALSREHHDALALAFRLHHPAPPGPVTAVTPASTVASRTADTIAFFDRHLVPHFGDEEVALFPALVAARPEVAAIVDTLIAEHQRMTELRTALEATGDDAARAPLLTAFADVLEPHIRREERELLAHVDAWLAPSALEAVAQALGARRAARGEPPSP